MAQAITLDYIKVKTKVFFQTVMIFLPPFTYSCLIICLIALGMMLSFDFILHTGHGAVQFLECIAMYFMIMELNPTIKKLVIFK